MSKVEETGEHSIGYDSTHSSVCTHVRRANGWKLWVTGIWVIFMTSLVSLPSALSTQNISDSRKRSKNVKSAALGPSFLFPSALPLHVPTQAQELWKLCSQPESFLAPHHTRPEACHEVREIFSSQKAYTALPEIHFIVAKMVLSSLNAHFGTGQ